ncbi:MAG: 1-acyl-sn-glycerol-3-phosphate acyltransferase [Defluviitaleaceae bacterium]|nr:1-acyl-sn-glycerol-3-phosphate acyltransferase [Defluviitaleaceae bacterium]
MLYTIARIVFTIYFRLFYRLKIYGREHLPSDGGLIVCANHISGADAMLVGLTIKRKVYFVGKEELFKNKLFGKVLIGLGAIPTNRSKASMETMRTSVNLLKEGNVLGIFAQGTRMSADDISSAKSGVSLFALKAKVPVLPIFISAPRFRIFSKIEVFVGKPLSLEKYEGLKLKTDVLEMVTEEIMQAIGSLKGGRD